MTQSNPDLREGVYTVARYTVSSATAIITMALFSDLLVTEHWLVKSRMLLRMSADYVGGFLTFHNIPFYRPVAGVFVLARLGGRLATKDSDAALWKRISAAGAAVAHGAAFHEKEPGWFRITFAIPKKQLVEGLRRVETGLGTKQRYRDMQDSWQCMALISPRTKEAEVATRCPFYACASATERTRSETIVVG